jgi:UDP-N-acetylmuramate--alanine ligase
MLGAHNVQNALAAIAVGVEMELPEDTIRTALLGFKGVKRRFTRTGDVGGITVIDDYGHHPVEIAAVLKAARFAVAESGGKVIAVFQPHRYSRLSVLMDGFCQCFGDAETVMVADVYAAGEKPIAGVDRDALVAGLRAAGHGNVQALNAPEDLAAMVAAQAVPGDYVVCLGAGNITQWAYALPAQLEAIWPQSQKASA